MTVTTNERNQQNIFAKEPPIYMDDNYTVSHNERAELLNGRLAMLGFVAACISYAVTGQIIPGIF
jgi:Chlorophyll A-B binding protein